MRTRVRSNHKNKFTLKWEFEPRLLSEHLGSLKYTKSARALGELIANAIDATASQVDVQVKMNELGGSESITVSDNGEGMSQETLRTRFATVGAYSDGTKRTGRLGRFGVGRFAVHRIGSVSDWTTVSQGKDGRYRYTFTLKTDVKTPPEVTEEKVDASVPCGTTVQIYNLRDKGKDIAPAHLRDELLVQFCTLLLAPSHPTIRLQGQVLNVSSLVRSRKTEEIPDEKFKASMNHVELERSVDNSRLPAQILFSVKGRTIVTAKDEELQPNYLALVDCAAFSEFVGSNNEGIIELNEDFSRLKGEVIRHARRFNREMVAASKQKFIERARRQEFYPYRNPSSDAITRAEQTVYDVLLERTHENVNLEGMTKRQQAIVFRLLKRAMKNESLFDVLQDVADLSDDELHQFKKVLERTTLESIIQLSTEVASRLTFLEALHQLVYGDGADKVKERAQLHKILEPHCWLFDARLHMATSDRGFRELLRKHRQKAGLPPVPPEDVDALKGGDDIPDLFLAATRNYHEKPRHHHVIVEIKAPSKKIGMEEVEQLKRYAKTIKDAPAFDKADTRWDLYLVSAEIDDEVRDEREQTDWPFGQISAYKDSMTLWVFRWSELIANAKSDMHLVRDHLKMKSQELKLAEYLQENFPHIQPVVTASSETKPDNGASPAPGDRSAK